MAPPLYRSQTRALALTDVESTLRNTVILHADKIRLGLADAKVWVTHRENPVAPGLLGKLFGRRSNSADPDAEHEMILVLHKTHLLVGTSGFIRNSAVLSVQLPVASAVRGSALGASPTQRGTADRPTDDGLTVTGFPGHHGSATTFFFGLGPGPDAEACVTAVMEALTRAKIPA